ncbi:aminopeptidase [Sphingobacterium sp. InxBP1]|uniref:aminopeptidase C n=1 Tax=Sphingobacterium sp. InxBP1 TaxID=2870328 RepID=UPI0022435316|nr:C1 family peptidase [Sphingobacterium sp. InxBP1]MCW8310792.1 aminopeptidase [Sphingobacterium sp. InxBP1]
MKTYKWISIALLALIVGTVATKYLRGVIYKNKYRRLKTEFVFTDIIHLGCTPPKNQGASNTCWSYTGNSFLESEMIRMGKQPVEISQIFTARRAYMDKARNFVRLHGGMTMGEGGQLLDVLHVFRKYGAVPKVAYSGLYGNQTYNDFRKMTPMLRTMLKVLVKSRPLTPGWEQAYQAALDKHLGEVPASFEYQGKTYTARSFADQVIGINPDDYMGLASVTDQPYFKPFVLLVPDNWSFQSFYNVPMQDLTQVIDSALHKGYTVAWTADVSEKGFSWPYGIAYVPEKPFDKLSDEDKKVMFVKPQPERRVNAEERQKSFDDWSTTDDHAMHIVGLAKDQYGKEYYLAKNSWGKMNDFKGYMYVTKEYVRYKTITLMLHRDALLANIKTKISRHSQMFP